MPDLETLPAGAVPPALLHAAFGAAFADYLIGPFDVPLEGWPRFLARQGVDLEASRVVLRGGGVLAFALVAPRPHLGFWRLATMGAVPEARGSGAAAGLLDDFIARAAAAGQRGVELECFAQNERALRLYQGRGFQVLHALYGYRRAPGPLAPPLRPAQDVVAVEWPVARARLQALEAQMHDLPLQVTPVALDALPEALRALQVASGKGQLVYSLAADGKATIHSLVDPEPGDAPAEALVRELVRRHPDATVAVPQLQREDLGGAALERLAFERLPLHQVMMRRSDAGATFPQRRETRTT